jgi:hypothetical protein
MGWFGTHKPEVVDEIILAAIKEVKTKHNVDKIGLTCVVHFFRRVLIVWEQRLLLCVRAACRTHAYSTIASVGGRMAKSRTLLTV